jgi:hypothetical protein
VGLVVFGDRTKNSGTTLMVGNLPSELVFIGSWKEFLDTFVFQLSLFTDNVQTMIAELKHVQFEWSMSQRFHSVELSRHSLPGRGACKSIG